MDLKLVKTISTRKKIKLDDLAKMADITRTTFYNYMSGKTAITADALKRLCDVLDIPVTQFYNQYANAELLESGEPLVGYALGKNVRELPLIHKFAHDDFAISYEQVEYLQKLPKYPVLMDSPQNGNYLCFELSSDNMFDGSFDSRAAGDIVLAREFNIKQWSKDMTTNKSNFILVHRSKGLLVRRVTAVDPSGEYITVTNLNSEYESDHLQIKDILAAFTEVKLVGRNSTN